MGAPPSKFARHGIAKGEFPLALTGAIFQTSTLV